TAGAGRDGQSLASLTLSEIRADHVSSHPQVRRQTGLGGARKARIPVERSQSRESRLSRGPESGPPERAASLRVGGRFGGTGRDRRDRRSPHAGIAFQAASRGGGTPPIAAPCPI